MDTGVLVAIAALWGAAAGSLLPKAAYRFSVPAGEAWRETCPGEHPIGGWLGRARCADCPTSPGADTAVQTTRTERTKVYGPSAPALMISTALVCAALAAATGARPELGVWLLLAPVAVLLTVVDFRVQRLPDVLTLPLAAAALALLGVVAFVPEHAGDWPTALYAAAALGAGFFVLFLVNPGGMGFGDVKLAVGLGAVLGWYGWATVMLGTFAAFLLGAVYGGALVLVRRAGRKTTIPFGPFLLSGAFLGLLIGAFAA
ncbi:prepilin peptidase [Streptomyces sp. CA-249302]|uniref:prepilin peptidase n=1 Tax=Streptomyces sp. CA-249302 TaxID=3240058 RepID=UPI003D928250